MGLSRFVKEQGLVDRSELDKLRHLAYFYLKVENTSEFSRDLVANWFQKAGFHTPNLYRLFKNASSSRQFVKGSTKDSLRLHAKEVARLDELLVNPFEKSTAIEVVETVLSTDLTLNTRSYIHSIALQINSSYKHNLFDACAILMRRLLEILLIHAYEHTHLTARIKTGDGNWKPLEQIVSDVTSGHGLTVSRDTKHSLDTFRTLGNYSAHKIHYICRKLDIEKVALQYRAAIEELIFLSNLKK